ncbi:MAG: hypothetical protein QOG64_1312 [Acidimicrobiaceae bacterium]|nr:hypothetical protein [Acidimicrobiaceae bacterium]
MKSNLIKALAASAVGITMMFPAGAAFASPAGRPTRDDGAAKEHAVKSDKGNSGDKKDGATKAGDVPVQIGDALRIERSSVEEPAAPVASAANTTSNTGSSASNKGTTDTPAGCPNTYHHTNTGNGANTSGGYDSTCDGSASQNGNGNGNAGGKPCAGCVGNADDKNPKGQAPNGSDHNNGYECDGNHGVGKGNPAHSGCQSSSPPVVTPPVTPNPKPMPDHGPKPPHVPGDNPGHTDDKLCPNGQMNHDVNGDGVINDADCVAPAGEVLAPAVVAPATVTPIQVLGETVTRPVTPAVAVESARSSSPLPFTGGNSVSLVLVGLTMVLMGFAVRWFSRRSAA